MKDKIDSIINGLIPETTRNISAVVEAVQDGAAKILEPGSGLINSYNHQVTENPQAFGFAFEHLQTIGFNIRASLQGFETRAYQIPADGTKYAPDIYVEKVGKVIEEIQAKVGTSEYVEKQVNSGHYKSDILTNSENPSLYGTKTIINVDGIKSFPISKGFAVWVAENPYLAANLMEGAALVGEVGGAGITGASINTTINILLQSIKTIAAYCRGEQALDKAELEKFLEVAINGLKSGFIRGTAIKVIQRLMGGNAFAALGFTLAESVIPVLIQVLQDKMTLEEAINQVGLKAFTSGIITTVVIIYPPLGAVLLSASVIQAVWVEISPEWQKFIIQKAIPTAAMVTGGAMVCAGASAGTVVTVASTLGAAASTGTAIGSLSGAAATNAALAWLGGGTLAAGGGGVVAGAAIVSAISTGGAVVAIAGIGLIGKQIWDYQKNTDRKVSSTKSIIS